MIARDNTLPDVQNFKSEVVFFAQARLLHPCFQGGSLPAQQRIRCKTGAESTSNDAVIKSHCIWTAASTVNGACLSRPMAAGSES